jgi:hypothetical protein
MASASSWDALCRAMAKAVRNESFWRMMGVASNASGGF